MKKTAVVAILLAVVQVFGVGAACARDLVQDPYGPFERSKQRDYRKLPSDSKIVQERRQELIRGLIGKLQELYNGDRLGDREVALAILELRSMLMDNQITDEEMERAREIRKAFFK